MSPAAESQPTERNVVCFEEFKAARPARAGAGTVESATASPPLTAPRIAHRFAMLGHLLGVERGISSASGRLEGPGHMSTKTETIDTLA